MTQPDTDPEPEPTTPGDLAGTIQDVQAQLREAYDATEVEIDADDITEWDRRPGGPEQTGRDEDLTITFRWARGDIPADSPERPAVLRNHEYALTAAEELAADFPDADLSMYANREHARVNLDPWGQR